jgi:sulfur carrier protein
VIVLNGKAHEQGAGEPLIAVLERLGVGASSRGVAVAVDGEVVPRASWDALRVAEGAHVEVLTAIQGG